MGIPEDCKRLAEVDFPIAVVSKHAAKEKSIRHGHPSTLHLWWARRPLASSRAVLLALLWPDPCDPQCPEEFKEQARKLLPQIAGCHPGEGDADLRKALLRFIADFANWDNAAQRTYLEVSRALVKAAHLPAPPVLRSSTATEGGGSGRQAAYEPPLVVDPFAGGGSIPLEALRLGCEAFASDLNPVACLILKVMLEDIPRHRPKLAEELRGVGAEIKRQVEQELADLYPKDPDGATPIAYLICRPRPDDASVGDWADVLRELPKRVGDWMERLQGEGVRGADLVFARIGPALEIFSRYAKVETAEGREVALAEYLEKVWEVVGRSALAQVLGTAEGKARNGAAGAVEEDARLTALFLWTLQSTNGDGPHPDPLPRGA